VSEKRLEQVKGAAEEEADGRVEVVLKTATLLVLHLRSWI